MKVLLCLFVVAGLALARKESANATSTRALIASRVHLSSKSMQKEALADVATALHQGFGGALPGPPAVAYDSYPEHFTGDNHMLLQMQQDLLYQKTMIAR